ncbi:hypothetical protein BD626DRAFT_357487, partial [Schizophyllum amplum]
RRPKDLGFSHDFDLRNDTTAAKHLSFSLSTDGRRLASDADTLRVPAPKKRKASDMNAPHSTWNPMESTREPDIAFEYPCLDDFDASAEGVDAGAGSKRKRQVDPMENWREMSQQAFLEELMWGEGLRSSLTESCCTTCSTAYVPYEPAPVGDDIPAGARRGNPRLPESYLLCCWECGDFTECLSCCLERHRSMPLHTIESWTGSYWTRVSLASLGLIYQLGHGGRACVRPDPLLRTMTVLDQRIHSVRFRFCGCRLGPAAEHTIQLLRNRWYPATSVDPETCATFAALDWFRLAAVHANVNAHNHIKVLETNTDALGLHTVPDREKSLARMARQYAFLLRMKRSGRGNAATGIAGTAPGEVAVRCWACPRPGVNLPAGWETLPEREKYRFRTILAVDANFRLKNRIRKNENSGPALGEGLGYFVDTAPYKEHIANYISSCIAFAALAEKDTKITKGLRVSGVGGVICARHEVIQPHGFADLQKGERYCNVDYVLCSVLRQLGSPMTTCSYDIGCQYMVNFRERVKKLPASLQPDPLIDITFGLPVWHGGIHEELCRSVHSLKYHQVGRTDGEGIERIWSMFNPFAWATKEMGEGSRHDWLEEKGDRCNFMKNVGVVTTLARRLVIAIDERAVQIEAFKRVNNNVEPGEVKKWKADVRRWQSDRSGPSPFTMPVSSNMSEAQVRQMLDAEEMQEIKDGRAGVHTTSQTAFLSAGLQLEVAQRRIMADIQGPTVIPMNLEGIINNRRRALLAKKEKFDELSKVHMPGAQAWIEDKEGEDVRAVDVEHQMIYLPSDFPANVRRMICAEGLPEKELKLRIAGAHDLMNALQRKLHAKQYHIEWRNKHVTGQKKSTRARALLETLQGKIELDAVAYRHTRAAILALRGLTEDDQFPALLPSDLRLEGEEAEPDAAAQAQLSRAGSSTRPRHIHVSTGKHQMSWLWTSNGAASQDDGDVLKTVRCLWAKALARKDRWDEEVLILQEDMRRCLRSLESEASVWRERANIDIGRGDAYACGTRAYALRHAQQWVDLRDRFLAEWNKPIGRSKRLIFE